ncbi:thioesterase II family protein [Actinacidiphila glaucinigra]|uniref:thioesterase II family protein n=1 Tax=Actinacidiphila glaucinigra TaxID=235986 RepID=UPI003D8F2310
MTSVLPRWLLCRERRPEAVHRLYCFPHSGASVGEYVRWSDGLPGVEVLGVQLPGRGHRMAEEPFTRMRDLVGSIVQEVDFEGPFAFFGHSLGALVAYETARTLRDAGRTEPDVLFVSALGAPRFQPTHPSLSALSDDELIAEVEAEFGLLPPELDDDPELKESIVSCLRADFAVLDTYRYTPAAPLDCRIVTLGGVEDDESELLPAWEDHTTGGFSSHLMSGGHFYLKDHHDSVHRIIAGALDAGPGHRRY